MSASTPRPTDRLGFALLDPSRTDNHDVARRWQRKYRHFLHIKRECEPRRRELITAHWRIDRLALGRKDA